MSTAPRIAVVDDELIVAKDLELSLTRMGYQVSGTAPTGEEAVTLATSSKPDLMLMDIRLRGELDGIEAARQIRHQLDVPIVFVTAFADEATLARARETHPYGYLVKPVQEKALRSTITTALNRHRADRQTRQSLKRQRALCDALGHLLWTAREDGRAEYFNQRWVDCTGLTQTASRGYGWVTALHPSDMHQCLSKWKAAVTRMEGFELICSVMQAGSKRYRRHLMRVVPMPDAPGGPQWLATLTDIHDYELRPEVSRIANVGALAEPTATVVGEAGGQAEPAKSPERSPPAEPVGATARSGPATEQGTMKAAEPVAAQTFRDWFCAANRCAPSVFSDRVFRLTLYFHALPIALLLWPWRKQLFAPDFALIGQVADAQWGGETHQQLDRLRTPEWTSGFARRHLRFRISTRRLRTLMDKQQSRPAQS